MAWKPLVVGEEAARLREIVDEIVAAVVADPAPVTGIEDLAEPALLVAHTSGDASVAEDWILRLREYVENVRSVGLFGGLARYGWTLAHLIDGDDVETQCAAVDQVLDARMSDPALTYDLVHGVAGIGIYALERGGEPALVRRVVAELGRRSVMRLDGATWATPSGRDRPWDLGLAHGVAGVIAFLGRVSEMPEARGLLDQAVRYLLSVPAPQDGGRFPAIEGDSRARLAWCYGDLGIATALVGTGIRAGVPEWRDIGVELARSCARRPFEETGVIDGFVCHGAAGNAHLFNRLAQATGDAALADAARSWLRRAVEMRGIALNDDPSSWLATQRIRSLLYGQLGIGLVLHAAISDEEPTWDRLLGTDVPLAQ